VDSGHRQGGPDAFGTGRPGASARAEYARRSARDNARRRAVFGILAPLVRVLARPRTSTEAWARGAEGEERVGRYLERVVGASGHVLHDRSVPRRRINLDHVVVVRSGVWVVDTKHYHGRLGRRHGGGWFTPRPVLSVGGRDQNRLLRAARAQRAVMEEALGGTAPVHAALCFTGVELTFFDRPFGCEGVLVTWPKALGKTLAAPGPLVPGDRAALAARLARAFPPYAR
jgi:Nuclease-related domain